MSESKYGKTALIDDVTKTTGLTRKQVEQVVNATLATIQQKVQAGQAVTLTGFGSFKLSQRSARNGINPQTRQPMQIPARTTAHSTPASNFLQTSTSGDSAQERAAGQTTRR
jgi:DNA-binding protein HU-beta